MVFTHREDFLVLCRQNHPPYFPIWNKLTPAEQQILERNAVLRKVDKGTVIHNGIVECTGLLLVGSGQLRAYILSDEGWEITLYRLLDRDICLFSASCSAPLHSDMGLLAIGVTPDTHLAKEAGLRLGIRGSIAVNERMETSVPDIYAVGDAVEVNHFVTGQKALISLAGPANKQGRIAADNICGGNSRFTSSQGSSVLKLFGLTAASTEINEKAAQAAGIAYDKVVLFPASHATYYPAHSLWQ